VVLVVLILIGVFASSGGTSDHPSAGTAGSDPVAPALQLSMTAPKITAVGGTVPVIPWVPTGQSAIAVPSAGLLETSGPEVAVPIASLTKMMTAYLTLSEHPLTATSSGPKLEMTAADQADFEQDTVEDASNVEVQAGEVLTERQLLTGLMVRSANNIADTLARWVSGSIAAFVAKMNAEAAVLGMTSTHYVDTNGLDAGSVSTAHDQLVLAQRAMDLPSFASIVDQTTVTLPYIGTLDNYVTAIGNDDVVGIKSGFTDVAMACVVLAAIRQVGSRQVLVFAADLGQPTTLDYAGQEDVSMIDAAASALRFVEVSPAHHLVGRLWFASPGASGQGSSSSGSAGQGDHSTQVETVAPLMAVAWPGSTVVLSVKEARVGHSVGAGAVVGSLEASSAGGPPVSVPVVALGALHS
jgi:D-alanyl-D-alanine carboxypeptidase (penicillin-binding protein 5/6)